MQERWVWIQATFTLLQRVIIQVSGSKFMLNHDFMVFLLYFIFGFVLVILLQYFACDLYAMISMRAAFV